MNRNCVALSLALVASLCALLFLPEVAMARDLGGAATSAVNTAKSVARVLSVFGLIVGGILMQLPGLTDFGKRTLGAGVVGCLCAFGGPSLITFFESVFGGG